MLAAHLELGRYAEDAALAYFLARFPGAKLLERNLRFPWGEIDLIFEIPERRELVLIEVRARSGGSLAKGYETLGPAKRARLRRAIRAYLASYAGVASSLRVDVLSWDSGKWTHLENVWI